MKRNESIKNIKVNDIVICINDYNSYKKDKKYKVTEVDDGFITVQRTENFVNHFPRIQKLNKLLEEYENCKHEEVKNVLDITLEPIKATTYFEDIFIPLKEQRKQKLKKIMETDE